MCPEFTSVYFLPQYSSSSVRLTLDNIIITPHVGTQTGETGVKMSVLGAQNLVAGLKGEPMPNCVNCHLLNKNESL